MMLVRDLFRLSLHNLLLHKVRSILTSLGVIFGVGSVIAMLAVSEGAKRSALAQIEAMGIDKIILFSKRPPLEGRSEGSENASVMERYGLTERDLFHISRMDNVERITGVFDARKKNTQGVAANRLETCRMRLPLPRGLLGANRKRALVFAGGFQK
ncbi:ABC transporter permease [Victivallis sp.]|uniref:ABC transporter permease n=1 Tax=Victivallis sp. TaxID=2049020 RepID=UPI003A934D71